MVYRPVAVADVDGLRDGGGDALFGGADGRFYAFAFGQLGGEAGGEGAAGAVGVRGGEARAFQSELSVGHKHPVAADFAL